MKRLLKNIVKIGVVAAIIFFGAPILATLAAGFIALKGVDVGSTLLRRARLNRAGASVEVNDEQLRHNEAVHRQNTGKNFFDFSRGQWDLRSLPLDMYPTIGICDNNNAMFSCCGVENVVYGSVTRDLLGRQKAEFSMVIKDQSKAQDVADTIARNGLLGTKVVRMGSDEFKVVSDNAVDISTLVKQFYPPRSFEVAREVSTTRQFVVSGCATYEDALKEFKENRHRYGKPDSVLVESQNIIDGHREPKVSSGFGLEPQELPLGSFVINETTSEYFSRNVTVNGGVDMTDEAMRSDAAAAVSFVADDKVEDRCSHEPSYSNGLQGQKVASMIEIDGEKVELLRRDSSRLAMTGACIYVPFTSQEELLSVLSGKASLKGRMVLLDKEAPELRDGEFLLKVPADAGLLSSLRLRGTESEDLLGRYGHLGITGEDIDRTLVCRDIDKYGYVSAEVSGDVDLSRALVNNVPAGELNDRLSRLVKEGRADSLNDKGAETWLREAQLIKSVKMDLDFRNRRLILTSIVQSDGAYNTKSEYKELTMQQMDRLSRQGAASQAELKDLVMRLHPDFFSLYQNPDGSSRYEDPILDFVQGRSPKVRETKKAEASEAKTEKKVKAEKVEKTEKKAAVKKTSKARRMA